MASGFPLMDADRFSELVADIKEHGQKVAIILFEGRILDGRNRYRACKEAGIKPTFNIFDGPDPVALVLSLNAKRRDLTPSQRAVIGLHYLPAQEDEARTRQIRKAESVRATLPEQKPRPREQIADLMNVSSRYVQDAKTIAKKAPEKLEAIRNGETSINAVMKGIKKSAPVPSASDELKAARRSEGWQKYCYRIHQLANSIRDMGGIEKITEGWSKKDKSGLQKELARMRDKLNRFIEYLES